MPEHSYTCINTGSAPWDWWEEGAFSSSGDLTRAKKPDKAQRSALGSLFGTAAESLFTTLFPGACRFCDSPLIRVTRVPVCDSCLETIRGLPDDQRTCQTCGERLLRPADLRELSSETEQCAACRALHPPFVRAVTYGAYEGALRDLIHLVKYEGVRPAAPVLGRMLSEILLALAPKFESGNTPIVIPVPLHDSKLQQRGFNQSELIARSAVKHAGLGLQLNTEALARLRPTDTQTGLTRHQRQQNIRGAFGVTQPAQVAGHDVLLIDDVYTTGTTVSECARVLRQAGAKRVFVATVARVLLAEPAAATFSGARDDEQDGAVQKATARAAHA